MIGGVHINIDSLQIDKMLEWLKIKLKLDAMSSNARRRMVKRGQVYRCNFGCGVGSEISKERPAIILQNDIGNLHSGNTIVIPITHDSSTLPCVASISPQVDSKGNIILDGQANASNVLCVSKARLGDFVCDLPNDEMKKVDEAIAKAVDVMKYYATVSRKLANREVYIEKIKAERNQAQDELAELRRILNVDDKVSLKVHVQKLKKAIDSKNPNC
ncbi:MAG: type II toxin-antitoxin system PemK/MazF family toxin [Agathobacter sp.]|nr:type II toxin-antitoxin system PemK/MazF family toxin [Agathobacter sp.]